MRTNRSGAMLVALLLVGVAATALVEARPATAQPQNGFCLLQRRAVDQAERPIAGMRVTLLETNQTVSTDADGWWAIWTPGPGTYTVAFAHPNFEPVTRRYVLDSRCAVTSATEVAGGAPGQTPPGQSPPAQTPPVQTPPGQPAAGGQLISGALTIEGQPAPRGTLVEALVGEVRCGSGRVTESGRYAVTVAPAPAVSGCAQPGSPVTVAVTPGFGSGWRVTGVSAFQANGSVQRDLAVELRRLTPDPANVPWSNAWWPDPTRIPIGVCGEMSADGLAAVQAALAQWTEASRSLGATTTLVLDATTACDDRFPGIAIVEDTISRRGAIAAAGNLDANLDGCRLNTPCWSLKGLIVINTRVFPDVDAFERPNIIAHELAHALGLAHSLRCNGGSIMWPDTQCRYPLTHVGVDDIASLNAKNAAVTGAPSARAGDAEAGTVSYAADAFAAAETAIDWSGLQRADGAAWLAPLLTRADVLASLEWSLLPGAAGADD